MTIHQHSDIEANIEKLSRDITMLTNVNRGIFDKLLLMVEYGEAMGDIKPVNDIIHKIAEYLLHVKQKLSSSSVLNNSLVKLAESIMWINISEEALKAGNDVHQDLNKAVRLASLNFSFIVSIYRESEKLLSTILIDVHKPLAPDFLDEYFQLRDEIVDLIIKNESYLIATKRNSGDIERTR